MHRTSSISGGWNQSEGLIFLEQTPAPFVLITAADTDIQTLAVAVTKLPTSFPALRVANLLQLQQQLSIDTYGEQVLELAQVIILRLLGGRSYWSYGLEVVQEIVQRNGRTLIVMPGDDAFDPDLISQSTVPLSIVNQVWQYFSEGGVENFVNALQFISDTCLLTAYNPPLPRPVGRVGLYEWGVGSGGAGEAGEQRSRGELELNSSTSELRSSTLELNSSTSELRSSISELDSSTLELDSSASKLRSSTSELDSSASEPQGFQCPMPHAQCPIPKIGILFYRAHYLAGNTKVIDALCEALVQKNLQPVPVFVSSLREPDVQVELSEFFQPKDGESIAVLLNTTSFSLARLESETPQTELWEKLDVPVLQVILSGGSIEQWESQFQGLSPRDIGMNVALPEVDGRIITRAVSFKAVQTRNPHLETDVVIYEPVSDRIEFVAKLAANWARLRSKPPQERRIALILANYPNRNGRLANGVGLDTPASCIEILQGLHQAGYEVENPPSQGDELIQRLTDGVTNDPEGKEWLPVHQSVSWEEYQEYFASLPPAVQQGISERWEIGHGAWGMGHGEWGMGNGNKGDEGDEGDKGDKRNTQYPMPNSQYPIPNTQYPMPNAQCPIPNPQSPIPVPGIQLGNVFVGIQPARGYDNDPSLNYHAPDLEPTHAYLAFYYWVRECFGADAVVHVGKHGNLEWLPGKSVALSSNCYPEVAFGALPHLYPFIVNDPGEGSQAKRRAQAVIIDHLTPPMTRAELYGSLQQLENLIDEYYEADSLDPSRLPVIRDRIHELVIKENLHLDLGIQNETEIFKSVSAALAHPGASSLILNSIGGYLCELKEAQIRDGLHIFGQCPQGRQLRDLIVAIARIPNRHSSGITRAIAQDWGLDFDPLTADLSMPSGEYSIVNATECRTLGDIVEVLEEHAALLVEQLINQNSSCRDAIHRVFAAEGNAIHRVSTWIRDRLLPALQKTPQEITHLLHGLDGGYVPSAPSGAPTRGRPEVLPTGRNFYSVDIRAIPTETAWDIGRKAAETLVEYYTQEHGEYPKTLGLSLWGTATMRTGGDDIAEALALLGVQPVWDGAARRVVDFEILPLAILGRPRVDVTLRISGFFRDAFPNLIDLFAQAVSAVADLDEPPEQNPLADAVRQETDLWTSQGLSVEEAVVRSRYRIFGSRPGAYGAGLQGLIESQNWTDDEDLARAYINWSSYAYSSGSSAGEAGEDKISNTPCPIPNAPCPIPNTEAFKQRLSQMQVVLHNQDNREHDLLDSDDYYQFQGGLTAAVRSLQGKNPETYFGDNSIPANPRVRQLKEEIARVYRSRVVNPKWIAGVMRHGYKGAFEMAATVDFLFAYDATAKCVEDYMYQGIVEAYLLDPVVSEFIQEKNPYALRDIAEKLLEAHKRNLWEDVNIGTLEALRNLVHQAEAVIEEKSMV
ncbi:cobaltochelatase subunit CobN [Nostoc commune NIES-4072]|uniref:Cobaltochelatase subunit CobN n=1 Tax=Nostoc commune NIES-4072 TaxID=2005467 RepID=A0A2R5FJ71_NOSCO|nr:cobaltochelatase subunit CobN [Nostoc commune]BBD64655.1 cobaltochelatase subunit CobN [Nostoc commune HK-02]GBG18019.1 cobaltochelatase subunit CobN [Nostoc commune NIES-4072]